MAIISANNVNLSYGINSILENISFIVNEGDKIGVVGDNGAGKSTLFKLIVKDLQPDSGNISMPPISVGYLEQNAYIISDKSIYDEVKTVFQDIENLENEIKKLEKLIADTKDEPRLNKLLDEYSKLTDEYNKKEGYSVDSKVRGVLIGLGFSQEEFDKPVSTLSGGQKTRLMLAKALLKNPNLLLLDEPTNHLDIPSIEWLEQYLRFFRGTVMLISHDRFFLDRIATRIFEIENKTLKSYDGNYTQYVKKKNEEISIMMKAYEEQQKEIKRIQEMIMIQKNRRREKSVKMAESKQKLLDKMEKIDKPSMNNETIKLSFDFIEKSGNDVLKVSDLSLSFDKPVFHNISFEVYKGDRIAILGPNGVGKTSLLKTIVGEIVNYEGSISLGTNVAIGYYQQEFSNLNDEKTIIDEIWDENPYLTQTEVRTMLGSFLFSGDDVFKQIGKLSGGEKARVSLLKLILSKANFLLLDEPTNHLDLKSKEVLEKSLLDFGGTLLFVSHDRYFIDKIATKVLEMSCDSIREYYGNYSYYVEKKNENNKEEDEEEKKTKTQLKNEKMRERLKQKEAKKQREYMSRIENEIIETEDAIKDLEEKMCNPDIYKTGEIVNTQSKYNELKEKLEKLYEEWESLSG
ncbi:MULTISPECIES: ribosomal protection-like ABC-F family protein [Thermoanaerobacterium]|uniref:ABC transporter n=2 Tax=Thermoanaerobacterium TaxID=28895 RepID=W9ECR0_9THEO|nr:MULTISPECIES: ABC-F type ribosomal protection protein [Thermoanaerobacterium]AFK87614.1 ABC transporter related protein [Thermoanaerobacterium saccharolyticum JW/SL-YS485]ETO37549.1 ABC transporter [Thermoanaerobacterium aotearoense SCUT27]